MGITGTTAFQPTRPLRGATGDGDDHCIDAYRISTHAPLAGRDGKRSKPTSAAQDFNPRAPCGARPHAHGKGAYAYGISTHAPLAGRDSHTHTDKADKVKFQPTRPLRGATTILVDARYQVAISTHAPLAGRDYTLVCVSMPETRISTHAPLAGRDCALNGRIVGEEENFNPRAPCGARHEVGQFPVVDGGDFNPRAPCGARPRALLAADGRHIISTHAPLAGRDVYAGDRAYHEEISTHAPLAGRDKAASSLECSSSKFQPTRPLRGATSLTVPTEALKSISTHAPLAGRDDPADGSLLQQLNISTHAPLAGRDQGRFASR